MKFLQSFVLFCYKIKPKIPLYFSIKSRIFSRPHRISSLWRPFATADCNPLRCRGRTRVGLPLPFTETSDAICVFNNEYLRDRVQHSIGYCACPCMCARARQHRPNTIRYDKRCYFNVRSEVSLIYRTEPTSKKWEKVKLKSKNG